MSSDTKSSKKSPKLSVEAAHTVLDHRRSLRSRRSRETAQLVVAEDPNSTRLKQFDAAERPKFQA